MTQEEQTFFILELVERHWFTLTRVLILDTNSAYANSHESILLQTKFVSKGKSETIFNATFKMVDPQALNEQVAALGIDLEEHLEISSYPKINLYVDIADLCFDPE